MLHNRVLVDTGPLVRALKLLQTIDIKTLVLAILLVICLKAFPGATVYTIIQTLFITSAADNNFAARYPDYFAVISTNCNGS